MIAKLKELIKGQKTSFNALCRINDLVLDYRSNKSEIEILRHIFSDREYADYFPFYKKATIVDIGAHYGYFSIFAHNNLDAASTIIAIEPNGNNYAHLEKNIRDSKIENVKCCNFAIGDVDGMHRLYRGLNPNHSIVDSYLLGNKSADFETVEVKTLSNLISEFDLRTIDFLKMDCEGAEYAIVDNTPPSVFDKIATISLEFHDLKDRNFTADALIAKLVQNRFRIVKFHYEKTSQNLNFGKLIATKIFS
jgi:FkbM family methyltransferase